MAEVRPLVTIQEQSISGPVSGTATGRMAYAVISTRGLANKIIYISSEQDLVDKIGKPIDEQTSRDFHICKSFIQYGNDLVVVRAINAATAQLPRIGVNFSATGGTVALTNVSDTKYFEDASVYSFATGALAQHAGLDLTFYAREASTYGNNVSLAICKPVNPNATGAYSWQNETATIDGSTKFSDLFEFGPDYDKQEIALVVMLSGVVVEKHIVSFITTNKSTLNENNYIQDWLDKKSSYIWGFANGSISYSEVSNKTSFALQNGTAGTTPTTSDVETAYSYLANKNDIEFDYITEGTHNLNRTYIISSIVEARKDSVAFFGPPASAIVGLSNKDTITANIVADRITLATTSWAVYIGNWGRVYDKYRDKNVWIPITGHVIGNKVRVNTNNNLWVPAAGTVNGVLTGIDALGFNPTEIQQNTLYKNGINHVVNIEGRGIVLDGQKTMTNLNIGVSRLNVRDLFRYMEGVIGKSARDYLHDFNDASTRARFVASITPFLEDIQRRRGITRFQVICDETNNPPAVVDAYGFRATVKVTGNKPIENIILTFYDVPNSTNFDEVAPA